MAYLTFAIVAIFFFLNVPRFVLGTFEVTNTWLILRCVSNGKILRHEWSAIFWSSIAIFFSRSRSRSAIVVIFFFLNVPRFVIGTYEVTNTWLILRCVSNGKIFLSFCEHEGKLKLLSAIGYYYIFFRSKIFFKSSDAFAMVRYFLSSNVGKYLWW